MKPDKVYHKVTVAEEVESFVDVTFSSAEHASDLPHVVLNGGRGGGGGVNQQIPATPCA